MRKWPTSPLIRYFDVGNSDAVLVTSLEAHKEILHEKVYEFQKPPFFVKLIADIVGFGIGFAEGEQHRQQRRGLAGWFFLISITPSPILPQFRISPCFTPYFVVIFINSISRIGIRL